MAKFGFQTAVTLIPPLHGETYDFFKQQNTNTLRCKDIKRQTG